MKVVMKLLSTCLLAAALFTFLSGCASEESQGYSPGQIQAQHSVFDPQHP